MSFAHFETDILNDAGGLANEVNVSVTVTNEATSALAVLYSDRAGDTPIANPITVTDGHLSFYTVGGAYKLAMSGVGVSRELRYVGIGTGQEIDVGAVSQAGLRWLKEAGTSAPPTAGCIRFDNADLSAATVAYVSVTTLNGDDMGATLLALTSVGKAVKNRARIGTADVGTTASWAIDSTADNTTYITLTLSAHDGSTSLPNEPVRMEPERSGYGVDGTGLFSRVRVVDVGSGDPATDYEAGDAIDSVTLAENDLVLRATSGGHATDGIYLVPASGAASRITGFDTYDEHPGVYVSVMEGTVYADTLWRCTSNVGGTLDTTAIVFAQFVAGGDVVGPASATDSNLAAFDTTGKLLKDSGKATANLVTAPSNLTDNYALRGDGGAKVSQTSGLLIDDNGYVSAARIGAGITTPGSEIQAYSAAQFSPTVAVHAAYVGTAAGYVMFQKSRNNAAIVSGDIIGTFMGQGADSNDVLKNAAYFQFVSTAVAAGSVDGKVQFVTLVAGSSSTRMAVQVGVTVGSPTGGDKGAGTLNATAVYDDNTLLTCMALQSEFIESGTVDLDKWDALTPDIEVPEHRDETPETYRSRVLTPQMVPVREGDRLVLKEQLVEVVRDIPVVYAEPVYDDDGNIVDTVDEPVFETVVTPAHTIERVHGTARVFKAMLDAGFDPRDPEQYFARMKSEEALPGMPTQVDWVHNSLSMGEMFSRKWLAMEMLAIVSNVMWGKIKDHETRIAALENARTPRG